jgi:hypothetical protein
MSKDTIYNLIGIVIVLGGCVMTCLAIRGAQNAVSRAMHRKFVAMGGVLSEVEEVYDPFASSISLLYSDTLDVTNINHK